MQITYVIIFVLEESGNKIHDFVLAKTTSRSSVVTGEIWTLIKYFLTKIGYDTF